MNSRGTKQDEILPSDANVIRWCRTRPARGPRSDVPCVTPRLPFPPPGVAAA